MSPIQRFALDISKICFFTNNVSQESHIFHLNVFSTVDNNADPECPPVECGESAAKQTVSMSDRIIRNLNETVDGKF